MAASSTLYLLPNSLGGKTDDVATALMRQVVADTRIYIIEEIKSARRWLRALGYAGDFSDIEFHMLNEHTRETEIEALLLPLLQGQQVALLSEAGAPCVADPGSAVVRVAHQFGIRVVPLSGPNAMIMALMASGLNGQSFAFSGYLPREYKERAAKLRQLEQIAAGSGQTQMFMDAPYRNEQVLTTVLETLKPNTLLCIAADITLPNEFIATKTIAEWKEKLPQVNKRPVVFAIGRS